MRWRIIVQLHRIEASGCMVDSRVSAGVEPDDRETYPSEIGRYSLNMSD
jgi:hypothetical protein